MARVSNILNLYLPPNSFRLVIAHILVYRNFNPTDAARYERPNPRWGIPDDLRPLKYFTAGWKQVRMSSFRPTLSTNT